MGKTQASWMTGSEWVVGLRVKRGDYQELRHYNVGGADEKEAIKNARAFEPGSVVESVRELGV